MTKETGSKTFLLVVERKFKAREEATFIVPGLNAEHARRILKSLLATNGQSPGNPEPYAPWTEIGDRQLDQAEPFKITETQDLGFLTPEEVQKMQDRAKAGGALEDPKPKKPKGN